MTDQPAAVDGAAYYHSLLARYDDPQTRKLDPIAVRDAFANGIGALMSYNSQSVADFQDNPNRPGLLAGWATAPLPAGPKGRFTFVGGANQSIWKTAKHPDAAFEWVRFLTGKASQQRFAVGSGLWPARTDAPAGTKLGGPVRRRRRRRGSDRHQPQPGHLRDAGGGPRHQQDLVRPDRRR